MASFAIAVTKICLEIGSIVYDRTTQEVEKPFCVIFINFEAVKLITIKNSCAFGFLRQASNFTLEQFTFPT